MTQKIISLFLACLFGLGVFAYTADWFSEGAVSETRGFPGGSRRGGGGAETQVVLSQVESAPYTSVLRTTGTVKSIRSMEVLSDQSGFIVLSEMTPNKRVEQGDVLLVLDNTDEKRALDLAKVTFSQAEDIHNRYEKLGGNTVTEVAVEEARYALENARISLEQAQINYDRRTLKAPLSGNLGLETYYPGTFINSGDVLTTIYDSTVVLAEFEVPERSLDLLEIGTDVTINSLTHVGRNFTGKIVSFDQNIDNLTRTVTAQAEVDNSENLFIDGMTLAVRISKDSEPLKKIPSASVFWEKTGAHVWVSRNGKAVSVPVTILHRDGSSVWVESELASEDVVVSEGVVKVRENAALKGLNDV